MNYETSMKLDDEAAMAGASHDGPSEGVGVAPPRKLRIALIALAGLFAAGLLYWLTHSSEEPGIAAGEGAQVPVVSVTVPGRQTVEGEIEATGTLAARRTLPVGSVGEGGRVVAVPVDAGDWVQQGQVLVSIDRSVQVQQIASAEAQVRVAQADASLAQANLDRAMKLVERGFISKADIDRLTATRDAAAARVQVARAQVNELRARTARLNIYAPASGLVLERNVEVGQTVGGGGSPLFTIARGGEMEMLARVGETELAKISVGVSAEIVPVGTDKSFVGQVWQVAPTINAQDRQGTVRIALSYATELRPGGFATARISSGTVVAPMLPESAIQSDDKGSYVYIVGKDNKVEQRRVKIGQVTDAGITIAEGLDGSERVVLRAGGFLAPGDIVKPVKAKN
ncbi:MAG: efflux RND transporter periplasmic adaptor subunit [Sphingomonadaceae bacterium]|nr:efflux RND transporter periplasmic adaptor subunit [Sphingomonadaceae bacterium]